MQVIVMRVCVLSYRDLYLLKIFPQLDFELEELGPIDNNWRVYV